MNAIYTIKYLDDWNGKEIEVLANEKTHSFVTLHPCQNILSNPQRNHYPPELLVALSKVAERNDSNKDLIAALKTKGLGHYCEHQSIESVQAIGWSVFGLVAHSKHTIIEQWVSDFFEMLGYQGGTALDAQLFLWRTLPKFKNEKFKQPSADVFLATKDSLTMIVYYWANLSTKVAKKSLKIRLNSLDQFLYNEQANHLTQPKSTNIVLVHRDSEIKHSHFQDLKCNFFTTKWSQLCQLKSHPKQQELAHYYEWKNKHYKLIQANEEQVA